MSTIVDLINLILELRNAIAQRDQEIAVLQKQLAEEKDRKE